MNDLPRGPLQPLPAPDGAFDAVTRRARARRTRTAVQAAGLCLAVGAAGIVVALPSSSSRSKDRITVTDSTPTPTPEPTPEPSPSSSPSPSPSPSPVDADEAAARFFIDAWRRGDTAGMRQVADAEHTDVVDRAMSSGTPEGQPECMTQRNGQYQCVVTVSTGKSMYLLVGEPGTRPGLVWWVAQVTA